MTLPLGLDLLPENPAILNWDFPIMIPDQGEFHENEQVHGDADRLRFEAGGGWRCRCEVCRKAGISDATFYNWRKKYAGLMPSEMKRLRQLEEENAKLKRIVADLSLDKAMLQDVLAKKH